MLLYGEVQVHLTVPFLRNYIPKLGKNAWALKAAPKKNAHKRVIYD